MRCDRRKWPLIPNGPKDVPQIAGGSVHIFLFGKRRHAALVTPLKIAEVGATSVSSVHGHCCSHIGVRCAASHMRECRNGTEATSKPSGFTQASLSLQAPSDTPHRQNGVTSFASASFGGAHDFSESCHRTGLVCLTPTPPTVPLDLERRLLTLTSGCTAQTNTSSLPGSSPRFA